MKPIINRFVIFSLLIRCWLRRITGRKKSSLQEEKFLLCVPMGGVNDLLCQIYSCLEYAEKYQRTLIIDTKKSGLFRDFAEFFEFTEIHTKHITYVDNDLYEQLNTYTCLPLLCEGRINNYQIRWDKKLCSYTLKNHWRPISFQKDQPFPQQLLVHQDSGGGLNSLKLLRRLKLTQELADLVHQQLDALGDNYVAIHIRNTDLQSHYKDYFRTMRPKLINQRILICSDSAEVIHQAKIFFNQSQILTTNSSSLKHNQCIHEASNYSSLDAKAKFDAPINAIIDLVALANAETVYYAEVFRKDSQKPRTSGFSRLAHNLSKDKFLLKQLIGNSVSALVKDTQTH